jgi:hypothetical protein
MGMLINSVTNVPVNTSSNQVSGSQDTTPELNTVSENNIAEQNTTVSSTDIESEEELTVVNSEGKEIKGVIRNLLNGHFKGVSDVRLRINFADEINELQSAEMEKAVENGVSGLQDNLDSRIESFVNGNELTEEEIENINLAADQFRVAISSVDKSDLMSELKAAFDEFAVSITPQPAEPEELPVEEESPVENIDPDAVPIENTTAETEENPEETPVVSSELLIEQFLADLTEFFLSELDNLEIQLGSVSVLPELSQPSGNGKAYDKFVALYNEMQGIGSEEQTETEPTEIII